MNKKTKTVATLGMLCALAYVATAVGRIPLVLFLKYDPKDVILTLGGFLFGPLASFLMALTVSFAELVTISEDGVLGLVMNVLSSSAFACTAAWIYKKKKSAWGAAAGLLCGWLLMVTVMMLWNYLIAPIYLGYPRQAVVDLLLPAFLPFNLIKGGLNAGISLLLFQPVMKALRRSRLVQGELDGAAPPHGAAGPVLLALLAVASCVLLALSLNKLI